MHDFPVDEFQNLLEKSVMKLRHAEFERICVRLDSASAFFDCRFRIKFGMTHFNDCRHAELVSVSAFLITDSESSSE